MDDELFTNNLQSCERCMDQCHNICNLNGNRKSEKPELMD